MKSNSNWVVAGAAILLICLFIAPRVMHKQGSGDYSELRSKVSLQYDDVIHQELSYSGLKEPYQEAMSKGRAIDRGHSIEAIIPKFDGKLSQVMLYEETGSDYSRAGRKDDAKRVCGEGIKTAEAIIKACPKARFIPGVHLAIANMIFPPKSGTWADAKVNAKAALDHVELAIRLSENDKTSRSESYNRQYYVRDIQRTAMLTKGRLLSVLGDEKACMDVYDELRKEPGDQTILVLEYARAEALIVLGNTSKAKVVLQETVKKYPHDSFACDAQKCLDNLEKPGYRTEVLP